MTIRLELRDGRLFNYTFGGSMKLFLWSLDFNDGVKAKNGFIPRNQIALVTVEPVES